MLFSLHSRCCMCLSASMKSFILRTYVLYMRRIVQKLQNQAELGAPVAPRSSPKIESKQLEIIGGLSGTAFFLFFEVSGLS